MKGARLAISAKLCHSLNLISGSRWPKAVAKSCGGHIQSIPHVIQGVADFQVYSLDSKRVSYSWQDSIGQYTYKRVKIVFKCTICSAEQEQGE